MIQLSHVPTPNGQAVRILLEELVDAGFRAEYQIVPPLRMAPSPEEWVPAIVDDRGSEDEEAAVVVFGSGYSLIYLGERFERFLGEDSQERARVMEWVSWQTSFNGSALVEGTLSVRPNPFFQC